MVDKQPSMEGEPEIIEESVFDTIGIISFCVMGFMAAVINFLGFILF